MYRFSYSEIQDFLNMNEYKIKQLPSLNLTVLRNITIEPIAPYLKYLAYQIGFYASIKFGGYDNIYQEAVDVQIKFLSDDTDCILIYSKLESLALGIARNFAGLSSEKIYEETERIKSYVNQIIEGIRKQTNGMILWHGFELPVYPAFGIWDCQSKNGQLAMIDELNQIIKTILESHVNAYFIDLNLCLARIGADRYFDNRYWHISRAPYTREALKEIATEDFKYVRALKGKNKKCLVLDCDNVLWGGIIGEDGLNGIKLGNTYPGSAYYEFQQEVLNLDNRGVILALCSKNNEADVWKVFLKHPDMVLRKEHIATSQINWQDKATNLRQIAMDLNIGLDSLVMVDDSQFEINLVRQELPEVETIHLPVEQSVSNRERLVACGLFDTLILTEEDKRRGAMYRSQTKRKKLLAETTNLEDYYSSLEMVLKFRIADDISIPRITQLTQKTNQFNLTTIRYSEMDIQEMVVSEDADVLYARLHDRFGDMGIIGVAILKYQADRAILDTFLVSCRALGRRIEDGFIDQCLLKAKLRGAKTAIGNYIATKKNVQVENFFPDRGFYEFNTSDGQVSYEISLEAFSPTQLDFFKRIDTDITGPLEV